MFPLPLTGAAHTLPRTASAARNVPKFLDETAANATKMHAQTDPAATPKATRLLCRRILVNHLRPAAAADCFQCLGLVAAYTRSLLPDCENNSKVLDAPTPHRHRNELQRVVSRRNLPALPAACPLRSRRNKSMYRSGGIACASWKKRHRRYNPEFARCIDLQSG